MDNSGIRNATGSRTAYYYKKKSYKPSIYRGLKDIEEEDRDMAAVPGLFSILGIESNPQNLISTGFTGLIPQKYMDYIRISWQ